MGSRNTRIPVSNDKGAPTMVEQHSLTDMNGETRSVRTGQTITVP